jgi:hypothetical protein
MNIQIPEVSESPPVSPKREPGREVGALRRVKRAISLKKSDSEINTISRTNSQKIISPEPRFIAQEPSFAIGMKLTRVGYLSELRKIHDCLKKTFNDPTKKIILTEANDLGIISNDDGMVNIEINDKVIEYIYKKILRAMTSHIDHFFDDKGYPVTLTEIDKLAQIKFRDTATLNEIDKLTQIKFREHQNNIKKDDKAHPANLTEIEKLSQIKFREHQNNTKKLVEEELANYYDQKRIFLWGHEISEEYEFISLIGRLPFPKQYETIPLNQKTCLSLLQRLYPLRMANKPENGETPIMAPITFLCSYKGFVTTDEFFEQVLRVIQLPDAEMPYLQKLRDVNLVRVWLSSHLFDNEKITRNNKTIIYSIITVGISSRKQEFADLCYEIYYLLEKRINLSVTKGVSYSLTEPYEVEQMLNIEKIRNPRYNDFLNSLTDEIKYASAQAVTNITSEELFNDKGLVNEAGKFYNQLVSFGVTHFIKTFNAAIDAGTDARIIKHKLNHFFEIFTDITCVLEKKHDFLSSFAMYSIFNIAEFSHLLSPPAKQNKNTNSKTRRLSLLKSSETQHKMQAFDEVFAVHHNFEALRKKMAKCQDSHVFFVPFLAPITQELIYKMDNIKSRFPDVPLEINNERLHAISEEIWEVNQLLEAVKENFKVQQMSLNTDIGYHLIADGRYDENELNVLYKKLKIILK